jgi:hypothetical protein
MTPPRHKHPELREARITQYAIGQKLRQMFESVACEPPPEDFLDILRRADERAARSEPRRH